MATPETAAMTMTTTATAMTYRDLLRAVNHDLRSRDDSRLDLPVVLAVADELGDVHSGRLVAFSVGEIPGGSRDPDEVGFVDLLWFASPGFGSVITSAARVAGVATSGVVRDGDRAETGCPDDFSVGEVTRIIDLREVGASPCPVTWFDDDDTTRRRPSPRQVKRVTIQRSPAIEPRLPASSPWSRGDRRRGPAGGR